MTGSKCKTEADDEVRKAMARARKFLADRGIDCAAPIHREDCALHVRIRNTGKGILGADEVGTEGRKDRRDALRKLADS